MTEEMEIIKEFLVESHENLDQLDRDFVTLETDPSAHERIAAIFRTIHTIKGTSGLMGFHHLEALTHAGEHLLSRLRDRKILLNPETTSELLRMVDAVRAMLAQIEAGGNDGTDAHTDLVAQLNRLAAPGPSQKPPPAASPEASADPPAAAPAAAAPRPLEAKLAQFPPQILTLTSSTDRTSPASGLHSAAPNGRSSLLPEQRGGAAVAEAQPSASDSTVRVDVRLLDKLMNLVGELVLARNQIIQHAQTVGDPALQNTTQRLNLITSELQEGVMKTRMQPIGTIWGKLPRVVRDLALACKKQARIELVGEDTELDRTIVEAIKDPLTHLVRNAVDHGVEAPALRVSRGKAPVGVLLLRAYHESGQVNIELGDDGGGIDPERIRQHAVRRGVLSAEQARGLTDRDLLQLIFAPGFSTAEQVTNVSGRGVGMDVVKTNIEKIGGTVDVQSRVGSGTTIKIKIPLTLAIIPALVVSSGGERFALPQVSLVELVRLDGSEVTTQIEHIHGAPVYRRRGHLLPLVGLGDVLNLPDRGHAEAGVANIVVVQADGRQFGLIVDAVNDTEEIVVKPLGRALKGINVFAGATIMGDGRVALILDVVGLAQRAGVLAQVRAPALNERDSELSNSTEGEPLLLLQVSERRRVALPLSLVARLEELPASAVEWAGGSAATQHRGEILRLVDLREPASGPLSAGLGGSLQVVVLAEQGRSVGLVVQQILDIVAETLTVTERAPQPGAPRVAVVQGRITELLDVASVLSEHHPAPIRAERAA